MGDLLRFTHNLETGELGGPRYIEEMHRQGILGSGSAIAYASGLFIGEYKGIREVQHGGSTAGYRGYLTRFPDHGIAVAVMCNASNSNAGGLAHQVADLYLADAIKMVVMGSLIVSLFFPYGLAGLVGVSGVWGSLINVAFYLVKVFVVIFFAVIVVRVAFARIKIGQAARLFWLPITGISLLGMLLLTLDRLV